MSYNNESNNEFNPDEFVQDAINGAMSTKFELVPKGDYSPAFIDSIANARKIIPEDPSKRPFASVRIMVRIEAPEVAEAIGRDKIVVPYELLLDLDPATGKLDTRKGKNTKLGRLRELVGQNNENETWSFTMLKDTGPFTAKVDWQDDNRDKNLPPEERRVYDRVVALGPAS